MNSSRKTKLTIIETGHLSKKAIAGGDRIISRMIPFLDKYYTFEIIIPSLARNHWKGRKVSLHILPDNKLERHINIFSVFFIYMIRVFNTTRYLESKHEEIIYSSTNVFVDVLPAFLLRITGKKFFWITRVHHLVNPPHKRPGNIIRNVLSYILDSISLFCIRSSDITLALHSKIKEDLINNKGFQREKVETLGLGIDFKNIQSQSIIPNTQSYEGVYLGRLHPAKGIYDLPYIWKRVTDKIQNARLVVIGESNRQTKKLINRMIKEESLDNNIILAGVLSDQKVLSILKKAKVFLFTDYENGWGFAVAESLACGLPIVGYDIKVLGTVFKQGYGKIIPLGDRDRFSKELIYLLQNEAHRKKLSLEAITESLRHDWKITGSKFHHLLEKNILPRTTTPRSSERGLIKKREAKLSNAPTVMSWVRGLQHK